MLAVVRGLKAPIFTPFRFLAVVYADVVRGIPTILLILLFGFGIPALNLQGLPDSGTLLGLARPGRLVLGVRQRGAARRARVGASRASGLRPGRWA